MDRTKLLEHLHHGQREVAELNDKMREIIDGRMKKGCADWPGLDALLGKAIACIEGSHMHRFASDHESGNFQAEG